ncbi:MAG: histidine phosphatase family protein [Candidatus Promineifilaceae bacterium]
MNDFLTKHLYLVRHGENPANISKVFSSRIVDQSLTAKGILQARQTATYFEELGISQDRWVRHSVFSSPLKRAAETAAIIADRLGLGVIVMENFREIDVGSLEDSPATAADWSFYQQVVNDWYDGVNESTFPGGENYRDLWTRLETGLLEITKEAEGQDIIVVGHGGIMTTTLKDLCPELDINWLRNSLWDNCAVAKIELNRQGDRLQGRLVSWNAHDHLTDEAAELIPGVPQDV